MCSQHQSSGCRKVLADWGCLYLPRRHDTWASDSSEKHWPVGRESKQEGRKPRAVWGTVFSEAETWPMTPFPSPTETVDWLPSSSRPKGAPMFSRPLLESSSPRLHACVYMCTHYCIHGCAFVCRHVQPGKFRRVCAGIHARLCVYAWGRTECALVQVHVSTHRLCVDACAFPCVSLCMESTWWPCCQFQLMLTFCLELMIQKLRAGARFSSTYAKTQG